MSTRRGRIIFSSSAACLIAPIAVTASALLISNALGVVGVLSFLGTIAVLDQCEKELAAVRSAQIARSNRRWVVGAILCA